VREREELWEKDGGREKREGKGRERNGKDWDRELERNWEKKREKRGKSESISKKERMSEFELAVKPVCGCVLMVVVVSGSDSPRRRFNKQTKKDGRCYP